MDTALYKNLHLMLSTLTDLIKTYHNTSKGGTIWTNIVSGARTIKWLQDNILTSCTNLHKNHIILYKVCRCIGHIFVVDKFCAGSSGEIIQTRNRLLMFSFIYCQFTFCRDVRNSTNNAHQMATARGVTRVCS